MIEINNLTKFIVDEKFFLGVAKKVLKGENKAMENLSIAFVNTLEIQKLNKKYRKKNKPTDVLSFEKTSNFKGEFSEIVICPNFIIKNIGDSKVLLKKELAKVLIHGILHNFGYDHEKSKREAAIMDKKQSYYLSKLFK